MNLPALIQEMDRNAARIKILTSGLTAQEARWKPAPDSWSVLEVINHLFDEEKEDFRVRLDIILFHPGQAWPPIDPAGWVSARRYNDRELTASLENFLTERAVSLRWLGKLSGVVWETEYQAPFGPIRAGDMLAAWVTHDHHHMRQLVELQRALVLDKMRPYNGEYAGQW